MLLNHVNTDVVFFPLVDSNTFNYFLVDSIKDPVSKINITAEREAFIILKDHKPNFKNNPTCRLINLAK